MPTISIFYGITIRMYFLAGEHNPPHVHAVYGEYNAVISIKDGNLIEGELPPKEMQMVLKWIDLHRSELLKMWATQVFYRIDPLE